MSYIIDGKGSYRISKCSQTADSTPIHGKAIGLSTLPELTEGLHSITVYLEGTLNFPTRHYSEHSAVYFTIDATPPNIAILSVENKTYNQLNLPLKFTINENTPWTGYSLDDEPYATLMGNTTLTLKEGDHSIVFYANDTAGNMGTSDVVNFNVQADTNDTLLLATGAG
jgi:hypothetical protein